MRQSKIFHDNLARRNKVVSKKEEDYIKQSIIKTDRQKIRASIEKMLSILKLGGMISRDILINEYQSL